MSAHGQTAPPTVAASSSPPVASPGPSPARALAAPEIAEAARRLFREGAQLASQGRWEEARDRFVRAIAVHPSPLLRFNLAIAAQNSGHFVEAIDAYRQFLLDDSDPANALRRQEAQAAIAAIENVLATLVITVRGSDVVAQLRLDGRQLPMALLGADVPVDPTEHVVDVTGARGGRVRQVVRLGEGQARRIVLQLDAPTSTAVSDGHGAGTPGVAATAPVSAQRVAVAAPGTIERVRHAIEERAARPDEFGRRRWASTAVAYVFQGIGSPVGLLGVGIRWAARPWFELEFQGGGGHPFGPGLGVFLSARSPWSYRYAMGLIVGLSTNFTNVPMGTPVTQPPGGCRPDAPFSPVWLYTAITHEWRVSMGVAFRLALGVRYLVNRRELDDALASHCTAPVPFDSAAYLAVDPPGLDRAGVPVMPWLMFDVGYAL
ncbi:MAG: tetratricopeptide repeat protein [Deltaproteobacteria bacterium]